jgi:hypothetical protein
MSDLKDSNVEEFSKYLLNQSEVLFNSLNSKYKRKKYYVDKIGYIKPEKVLISRVFEASNEELEESNNYGYYIPFEKSVTKLIENIPPNIDLNANINANLNLKKDIFDGKSVMKKENLLQFCIYCDEAEFVNAIGPNRTIHKLSIVK